MKFKTITKRLLMRLFLLAVITSLGASFVFADSHGQSLKKTKVNLKNKRGSVSEIIDEISQESGYVFLYDNQLETALSQKVTIENAENLHNILTDISKQAYLEFRAVNQNITIRKGKRAIKSVVKELDPIMVSGLVTDDVGDPLVGATVLLKGTTQGTITDVDGKFQMQVPDEKAVLVVSFIGFVDQEIVVGNQTQFEINLQLDAQQLSDVVVTALGIKREEQSLGFSVGRVDGEEVTRVAQENVLNGIAGKVPGVVINSTGGAGSSVSMVIRGATSLSSDNQPLFVIDGVPISNTLNNVSQFGDRNTVDYGNAISDLNPNDIESMSILKGPSAAALYGSRAGNGVVIITTKSGKKAKGVTVNLTSNTVFDNPYKYLDFHSKFATGVRPYTPDNNPYPGGQLIIEEGSAAGVGPRLDQGYTAVQWNSPLDENGNPIPTELRSYENNVANFVQTGINTTNGISLSNSNDILNYRLGFTNMTSKGIVPNSDLYRNNFSLNSSIKASKKLTISSVINVNRTWSNNRPSGNRGTNPLEAAYKVSPHINILDLKDYWEPGLEGLQQRSQAPGDYNNPYFLANEINNSFTRDRVFGNLMAEYQITPEISLMGRYALDQYTEVRETKGANSYTRDRNGIYGVMDLRRYERNADFLASYGKDVGNFNFNVSFGGNARYNFSSNLSNSTTRNSGLIVPNVFTVNNIQAETLAKSSYSSEKVVYSLYGIANLGYKDMVYLDITGRNDWSSTLPASNRSYFYPSAALSLLLNQMVDLGPNVDMVKLRGGWAQVGNDTDPYSLYPTLNDAGGWGGLPRLSYSGTLLTPDLKPEIATSWEGGLDLGLFNNRLRFEGTYYVVQNENQVLGLTLPPSSGYNYKQINAGLLESKGWELLVGGTPVQGENFRWDVNFNISRNRTKILELNDGIEIFTLWSDAKGGAWTYVGEEIGDIYDRELVTVKDPNSPYYGYPILDENGSWQDIGANETKNKIGNFNPNFLAGLQTSLSYKNFALNMTFDWRNGGQFVSQTYRYSESDLKTQRWLDQLIHPGDREGTELRDWLVANEETMIKDGFNIVGGPGDEYGGYPFTYGVTVNDGVFNPGVIAEYDEEGNVVGYTENLGGADTKIIPYADNYPWNFTKASTFDADYVKLREISLSYSLPKTFTDKVGLQRANVAVFSRNIILWTKAKVGIDPENAFQPEASVQGSGIQFKQGIERYNITPWVIPVGFKLDLTF
ncbi:SusC/RagA family TonB-linked outer membrane protein [Flexithrix dorotheae]|uniref:SusC/RagA family TonB-linked outer membrane protein n=1 Tax=Flexithrix dorotheae TaxID=70993 RepID=UPI0003756C22|nr:SusC/RagA family TonB-linked outer membrane protein [Flexithrix dorotheae]